MRFWRVGRPRLEMFGAQLWVRVDRGAGHGSPDKALDAIASLAEWCDGDQELLAHARADVLRDMREAHIAIAENNQDAVSLLELAGRTK